MVRMVNVSGTVSLSVYWNLHANMQGNVVSDHKNQIKQRGEREGVRWMRGGKRRKMLKKVKAQTSLIPGGNTDVVPMSQVLNLHYCTGIHLCVCVCVWAWYKARGQLCLLHHDTLSKINTKTQMLWKHHGAESVRSGLCAAVCILPRTLSVSQQHCGPLFFYSSLVAHFLSSLVLFATDKFCEHTVLQTVDS